MGLVFVNYNGQNISLSNNGGAIYNPPVAGTRRLNIKTAANGTLQYGFTTHTSASAYSPAFYINGTKCYIGRKSTYNSHYQTVTGYNTKTNTVWYTTSSRKTYYKYTAQVSTWKESAASYHTASATATGYGFYECGELIDSSYWFRIMYRRVTAGNYGTSSYTGTASTNTATLVQEVANKNNEDYFPPLLPAGVTKYLNDYYWGVFYFSRNYSTRTVNSQWQYLSVLRSYSFRRYFYQAVTSQVTGQKSSTNTSLDYNSPRYGTKSTTSSSHNFHI